MNLELLQAEYEAHFTAERRATLLTLTREAYERALICYSEEDGGDRQLFGFTLFKYVAKRLTRLASREGSGFELRSGSPLRVGVGPFTLAAYSCGSSGDQPISESFPNNENGAPQLVDLNQFCLDLDTASTTPRALVLAHLGNPYHGLEALHLAFPASKEGNRISAWSFTDQLWRPSDGFGDGSSPPPDLPPPTLIDRAPLSLKLPSDRSAA